MTWERTASAVAAAPATEVWRVLTDGPRWAEWTPHIAWLYFEGPVAPGTIATMLPADGRQTAFVVEEAAAPHRLALGLTAGPVARLRLCWTLAPEGTGTRIEQVVAIDGPLSFLLKKLAQRTADAMPGDLGRLARRAETAGSAT